MAFSGVIIGLGQSHMSIYVICVSVKRLDLATKIWMLLSHMVMLA